MYRNTLGKTRQTLLSAHTVVTTKREMSPKGQRRGQFDMMRQNESSNERLTELNDDEESDPDIKYTGTPLPKINVDRLQRRLSAPIFDSEESTDALKVRTKRRRTSRSLGKERMPGARAVESTELGEKRQHRTRRRRSEGSNCDLEDDEGNIGKERRTRRREERSAELPIAELLRRAQETQKCMLRRYEDPIPLPELTTDTLYVQGRNGFSAVKIGNFKTETSSLDGSLRPIHIAVKMHNLSKTVMFFCQGLLGGIALSQVILMTKIQADSNLLARIKFIGYPHLMSGLFLFLVAVSLLAEMDRIDMAHIDLGQFRGIISQRCIMIVTCPLYLAAICIHLSTINIEQSLTSVGLELERFNATSAEESPAYHHQTHIWKFVICIIAWFFVALGPSDDLTTTHLAAMEKYAA